MWVRLCWIDKSSVEYDKCECEYSLLTIKITAVVFPGII